MSFQPINRHLLLEPIVQETKKEKKSTILVPDDYSVAKSQYETYSVLAIAKDCEKKINLSIGDKVVVDNRMVEEVKIKHEAYYLLLENYVYGIIK